MLARVIQRLLLPLCAFFCALGLVQAATIQVGLSSLVNSDLTTYTDGSLYPQNGGPLTVAGVPFTLATLASNGHTAVIQSSTTAGVTQSYVINVGQFGVTTVNTLINSAFGSCGTNVGELDFAGANPSDTFTYVLTEGVNVRDHFNGVFCNTVTNVAGTAFFGSLDRFGWICSRSHYRRASPAIPCKPLLLRAMGKAAQAPPSWLPST